MPLNNTLPFTQVRVAGLAPPADAGNPENIFRHVAETHSTPMDVGRMASEAKVRTVVLNHQLRGTASPGGGGYPVSAFIDGVRSTFAGEVIVGEDQLVI